MLIQEWRSNRDGRDAFRLSALARIRFCGAGGAAGRYRISRIDRAAHLRMGDRALFVLALRAVPSNNISRVYDPHTLSIMAIAFDRACDFLPVQFRDSDYMRRKVASHIIRHVNDGESDPTRLADSAIVSIFW